MMLCIVSSSILLAAPAYIKLLYVRTIAHYLFCFTVLPFGIDESKTPAAFKMKLFVTKVNSWKLLQSSSAAVLAASWDRLRPHGSVQVSTLIQSSSAAVLAASIVTKQDHKINQCLSLSKTVLYYEKLRILFKDFTTI